MAGYQNNMRYGRPGNMYRQRNNDCSCDRQQIPERREDCGCDRQRMPERREDCGCDRQRMHEQHENHSCNERQAVSRDCGCERRRDEFGGMPLAMAYVPWQTWCDIYDICEGFQRGTIFQELDMPFHGRGGCNR